MIERRGSSYVVLSEAGRLMGTYATEEEARARLAQIERFSEDAAPVGDTDAAPRSYSVADVSVSLAGRSLELASEARADGIEVQRVDAPIDLMMVEARDDAMVSPGRAVAWIDEATGFLHARAPIARTGPQTYSDTEGHTWVEYRSPDEVFDAASLQSFARAIVTDDHPRDGSGSSARFVDVANVRDVGVGHLGSDQQPHGRMVISDLTITDADTISEIKAGKRQISPGYHARVIAERGTAPDGTRYDARQTQIRINHIAIVTKGRSGPDVALPQIGKQDNAMPQDKAETTHTPQEVKADAVAPAPDSTITARMDALTADLAAKDAQIEQLKAAHADAIEAASATVARRVELVARAAKVLDAVDHTRTDHELMRDVVLAVRPSLAAKLDDHAGDAGYLAAMFDSACDAHDANAEQASKLDAAIYTAANTERVDLDDLAERFARRAGTETN